MRTLLGGAVGLVLLAAPAAAQNDASKTAKDILVLDPMKKTIIAVLPRKFPSDAKANAKTPADWADTKGREMTGQAPQGSEK